MFQGFFFSNTCNEAVSQPLFIQNVYCRNQCINATCAWSVLCIQVVAIVWLTLNDFPCCLQDKKATLVINHYVDKVMKSLMDGMGLSIPHYKENSWWINAYSGEEYSKCQLDYGTPCRKSMKCSPEDKQFNMGDWLWYAWNPISGYPKIHVHVGASLNWAWEFSSIVVFVLIEKSKHYHQH